MPCGQIRLSVGKLDADTTAKLSYVDPGPTEPLTNFKPISVYRPPSEPIHHDTTQKLSYRPCNVPEKETRPWQLRPTYRYRDSTRIRTRQWADDCGNENACLKAPGRCDVRKDNVLGEFSEIRRIVHGETHQTGCHRHTSSRRRIRRENCLQGKLSGVVQRRTRRTVRSL